MSRSPVMRKRNPANKNNPTVIFCSFTLSPYNPERVLGLANLKRGVD
jgi:hypothetical protein